MKEKTTTYSVVCKMVVDRCPPVAYNEVNFRGNWRKKTTAGGENSGESRKGAEGARQNLPNLSGKRTET